MTTAYKIDPAGENKYGTTDLTSLNSFSYDEESDEVTQGTDGSQFVGGAYVDNKRYRVTVNGADNNIRPSVGSSLDLVLIAAPRANGDGTSSPSLTFTFTGAVCQSTSGSVNHAGVSETNYVFIVPGKLVAGDGAYIDPLAVTTA